MNKSDILSIYAAVISTTVAVVQITNLIRTIEKDRLKVKVKACVRKIDVSGIMPHQEEKEEGIEYKYSHIEDGQLVGRTFSDKRTGNIVFEGFAYKEKKALVLEILNDSNAPLYLSYIGFRLPNRTNLPIPFDLNLLQTTKIYPRHEWLNYQRRSSAFDNTVRSKGKSIFWIEVESFYQFLLTQGIQGRIKIKPFIEDEGGKPIDGKAITLSINKA